MNENNAVYIISFLIFCVLFVIGGIVFLIVRSVKRSKSSPPERPTAQAPTIPKPITPSPLTKKSNRIPQYSYNDVNPYILDNINLSKIKIGDPLELRAEPDNQYDKKAVAIYHNNVLIGYLHRNRLQGMYHDFTEAGGEVTAKVAAFDPEFQIKLSYFNK